VSEVSRDVSGATAVGRSLCAMGLACYLAGILLADIPVEIPGIAMGVAGYGFAARAGDLTGQVLGVVVVVLCGVSVAIPFSVAIPSFDAPGLFLKS
jgi:hypothetical protein